MQVVPDAGHSANEVGIAAELRSATEKLRDMWRKWAGERHTCAAPVLWWNLEARNKAMAVAVSC
jgi:hypothetical protein